MLYWRTHSTWFISHCNDRHMYFFLNFGVNLAIYGKKKVCILLKIKPIFFFRN